MPIAEILIIKALKKMSRSAGDREKEKKYGISQRDVLLYLGGYKQPLDMTDDYHRTALDDEKNWETTKHFIEIGELESAQSSNERLARTMKRSGILRLILGLIVIVGSCVSAPSLAYRFCGIIFGLLLMAAGWLRAWVIVHLVQAQDRQ